MDLSPSFKELGLSAPLLQQLEKLNYKSPTPIQAASIPVLLQKKDIMGLAQTGTGKTAAFALPLIQVLSESRREVRANHTRALILSPTRELALQIHDNIVSYGKALKLSSAVIFGGVGYGPQIKALGRGVDILVATPGRLIDHMEKKTVRLEGVETLILDEADRMLDMGFAPDLRKIVAKVPTKRHTQLFSATMPDNILKLATNMLRNPETIMITPPTTTAEKVEQSLCHVSSQTEKREVTLQLLRSRPEKLLTLMFTRTKHGANKLASFLSTKGFPAGAIHGNKSQSTRERMLREFRTGKTPILVATDIAARGIDVKNIDLVINFDLPMEPEVYIHRIGRTARAEASGTAITLCSPDELKYAKAVQKTLGFSLDLHEKSKPAPAGAQLADSARPIKRRRHSRDFQPARTSTAPQSRQRRSSGGGQRSSSRRKFVGQG